MALRATWKGVLKVADLTCPVAFHTAVSTAERIAFHTLNRKTGNRVHRQFVDSETGAPVEADDQVKGYETEAGEYVVLEAEDIAAAIPDSDKILAVECFVACDEIDDVYLDRPYYMTPGTPAAAEAFALIRAGLQARNVAAIGRTMMFRRMRSILIRARGKGLIGTTLTFDYEIRSATEAFSDVKTIKIQAEMLDLAKHIIATKAGTFDPKTFDDRYETALAELVKAKLEGRKMRVPRKPAPTDVTDLMEALRRSAKPVPAPKTPVPARRRKAG